MFVAQIKEKKRKKRGLELILVIRNKHYNLTIIKYIRYRIHEQHISIVNEKKIPKMM